MSLVPFELFQSLSSEQADEQLKLRWEQIYQLQNEITLLEHVRGATPALRQQWQQMGYIGPRQFICEKCSGTGVQALTMTRGQANRERCADCDGDGYFGPMDPWHRTALDDLLDKERATPAEPEPMCLKHGHDIAAWCPDCARERRENEGFTVAFGENGLPRAPVHKDESGRFIVETRFLPTGFVIDVGSVVETLSGVKYRILGIECVYKASQLVYQLQVEEIESTSSQPWR